jgi:phospholipid-binding lipoprotein MlaA
VALFLFTTVNGTAEAGNDTATPSLIAQSESNSGDGDPLEPMNRVILDINEFFQDLFFRPLTQLYVLLLPDFALDGIHNVLTNLTTPITLANDLLQGEGERAWITTQRFFINTTVGIGGLMDPAKDFGLEGHKEDFGQTFAVWGVPEGFYLVLPIFGPSNPRDAVGLVAGAFLDPLSHWLNNINREEIALARTVVSGVDEFSGVMDDLEKLKETSIDYYAALRSIARQKRQSEINNGAPAAGAPLPDLKYDFNAEFSQ